MQKNTAWGIAVPTNIQVDISSLKMPSFAILKVKNEHFHAISCDSCNFPNFKLCPIWVVQKVLYCHFCTLDEKLGWKHLSHQPQPKFFSLTFLWPRDFELSWTKYAPRRHGMVLIGVPDTIHVDLQIFFAW